MGDDLDRRTENGRRVFREVTGLDPPTYDSPATSASMLPHVFGEIWERPGLTRQERRWISLTCAALSGAPMAIEAHIRGALVSGDITVDELREWVLPVALYAGWPTASAIEGAVQSIGAEQAR